MLSYTLMSILYLNLTQISIHSNTLFSRTKKVAGASDTNPMPRPLPASNLRADFRTVSEGEHHPAIRMYRCVIHQPVEQLPAEIHRQLPHFLKPRKETAEKVVLDFPPLPFLFNPSIRLSRAA